MMETHVKEPERATARAGGAAEPGAWERPRHFLRKVLLSQYFVLYLSVIYFLVLVALYPAHRQPAEPGQHLFQHVAACWPSPSARPSS
jgi:hypothetical protein